jgi:hypothetical protein
MLDDMVRAYLTCALWSSLDEAGEPLDANKSLSDFASEAVATATADCNRFLDENRSDLEEYCFTVQRDGGDSPLAYAGHDLWLTRNGHGAGFWDRAGIEQLLGDRLTAVAEKFGTAMVYVGEGGKVYIE